MFWPDEEKLGREKTQRGQGSYYKSVKRAENSPYN